MEGVEVLNTFVKECCGSCERVLAVILGIVGIAGLFLFILYCNEIVSVDDGIMGITLIFSIISIFLSAVGFHESFLNKKTTYYQVLIDDSVSMVEFNEKYDIVKVEGKIYTIKEKEN